MDALGDESIPTKGALLEIARGASFEECLERSKEEVEEETIQKLKWYYGVIGLHL